MYFVENIELNNSILNIIFSGDIISENTKLVLRSRDMERFLLAAFDQSFELKVDLENGKYIAKLDLNDLINKFSFENLNSNIIWIQVLNDGIYKELELKSNLEKITSELGHLCKVNLFKRKNNALGIKLTKINVNCDLQKLEINDKCIKLKVSEGYLENKNKIKVNKILLKKRVFKNISSFNSYIELEKVDDNNFILNFDDLEKFDYEEISILEFIAQFKSDNLCVESLIKISPSVGFKNSDHIKYNKNYKLYKTQKGSIAIKMNKLYNYMLIDDLIIQDDNVSFNINANNIINYDKVELLINKKVKLYDEFEYIEFKNIESIKNGDSINFILNLKELFNFATTNYDQVYEVILKVNYNGKESFYKLYNNDKNEKDVNNIKLELEKEFLIKIDANNINKRKIAVLGSCFSRAAFNSKDEFFNLDYRRYFEISYTHFWFSVISLLGEKIDFDINHFNDIPEKEIKHIIREYTKNTFLELKNLDSDYIIIDFFLDAIHGVRVLDERKYLAINPYLNKSQYYKNTILGNSTQFDYRKEKYFEVWKKSCDLFIESLKEIIGLDKVVLSLGGLTEKYYDKDLAIRNFVEDNKFTRAQISTYNKIWMRMNNYFLAKAPEAKVIDLSKYNYIGYENHPASSGPHHYETNYYKSFLGELAKIITFDKC